MTLKKRKKLHKKTHGIYEIKQKIHMTKKLISLIFLFLLLATYIFSRPIWINAISLNLVDMTVNDQDSFFLFDDESLNLDINESISKKVVWKNTCRIPVFYRFYISDLKGDVTTYLLIKVQTQNQEMLYDGLMKDFNLLNAIYSDQSMPYKDDVTYTFTISLSERYQVDQNTIGNLSFILRYEVSLVN